MAEVRYSVQDLAAAHAAGTAVSTHIAVEMTRTAVEAGALQPDQLTLATFIAARIVEVLVEQPEHLDMDASAANIVGVVIATLGAINEFAPDELSAIAVRMHGALELAVKADDVTQH